jgi:hypothetical protein
VDLYVGTNVSEKHTASIFRTEDVITQKITMDTFTFVRTSDLFGLRFQRLAPDL